MKKTVRAKASCVPFIVVTVISSIGVALVVVALLKAVPLGVENQWVWFRIDSPRWDRLWIPAVFFLIFAGLIIAAVSKLREVTAGSECVLLVFIITLSLLLQLSIGFLGPVGLQESLYALATPRVGGYWNQANEVDSTKEFLDNYPSYVTSLLGRSLHHAHPPGAVLVFLGINRFLEEHPDLSERFAANIESRMPVTAAMGRKAIRDFDSYNLSEVDRGQLWLGSMLLRLLACLTAVPAYLIARKSGGKECALYAAAFCTLIPGLLIFSPGIDQILPVMAVTAFGLTDWAVARRSVLAAAVAGGVFYIVFLFSFALLVVLVMIALAVMLRALQTGLKQSWRRLALLAAAWFGGFLLLTVLAQLVLGYDTFPVLSICFRQNELFNATSGRSYLPWLLMNPVDFALFLGVPIVTLSLFWAVTHFSKILRYRRLTSADVLTVSFCVTLAMLWLSGKNLGEVGRLWLFLMPFACIMAARQILSFGRWRPYALGAIMLLQFVQIVCLKLSLDVLGLYSLG